MAKKTKESSKLNILMLLVSILLIVVAYLLNEGGIARLLVWFIGVILLLINLFKTYKLKIHHTCLLFACVFLVSIFLDGIITITLKKIPLFAYNIIHTGDARVYNGVGIRVWQCDKGNYKDLVVDPFYNKGYICNSDTIPAVDVNSFLNSVVENYNDYKNSYIKIHGKVSKKTGQNYLEMQPYENSSITVNGYVNFANNITLRILFNENTKELDAYDVYDEITIIGIIKNLEQENNNYVIYMYDSKVVSNIDLNEFTISVTEESNCSSEPSILYSNDTMNVYTYCIDDMIIAYPNDNKYEIANALSSNKIKIEELLDEDKESIKNESDNTMLYKFAEYNMIVCDPELSKDIFIGSKDMSFNHVTCSMKNPQEEN